MILALLIVNTFGLLLMAFALYHLRQSIELNRTSVKTERAEVLDFVRQKIQQRLNDFKSPSGRERLRARLAEKRGEARGADEPSGVVNARN